MQYFQVLCTTFAVSSDLIAQGEEWEMQGGTLGVSVKDWVTTVMLSKHVHGMRLCDVGFLAEP